MVKFNVSQINWEMVKCPSPMFKLFEPSQEKFGVISRHLMEGYLNLSDEFRIPSILRKLMQSYFVNPNNLIFEVGNNQALIGFINIVPNFKSDLIFKLFDKNIWGLKFAKEAKDLLNFIMDTFALKRINTSSPDERIVKMARMFGFEIDGKREEDFMFDNEPFLNYLLGLRRK